MKKIKPPYIGQKILKAALPEWERKYYLRGIEEVYRNKLEERGYLFSQLWYWKEIILAVFFISFNNLLWSVAMLNNYLKMVFRLIQRKKLFSLVNLLGLTIGLTSSFLILLYVDHELTFDKFHENTENIYRVYMHQPGNQVVGSSKDLWVTTPTILKPTWEKDLPEIDKIANVRSWGEVVFLRNGQQINERIVFADPELLEIFTFPLSSGSKKTALNDPFSLLITQRIAEKYFAGKNPVGQTMLTSDKREYKITGVLENIPENSHLKFDFLASFNTLYSIWDRDWDSDKWLNNGFDTYLTLPTNIDLELFDDKLSKYDLEGFNNKIWSFHVQPLKDIHFNRDTGGQGDIRYIYIYSAVGLFILFIACFNFINLSTARSAARAKEVGIRKVVGAYRQQLTRQLLGESFLFTFIALTLAILATFLILPAFSSLFGKEFSFSTLLSIKLIIVMTGITLLVGIVSGSYPALFLSSFQPVKILKGNLKNNSKGTLFFRNSLVVIQFAISIIMIICTITLYQQLHFVGDKKLGYTKDHILTFHTKGVKVDTLKEELLNHPEILQMSVSSGIPTRVGWSNIPSWEGKDPDENPFFYRLNVDYDFIDLYELELIKGRKFSQELGDKGNAYILNEAAVKRLGFDEPIGQLFGFWKITGSVIGVVKDFHFESLHKPITPLGIGVHDNPYFNYVSVKIRSENISGSIGYIKKTWKKMMPDKTLEISFIDEQLDSMYQTEKKMAQGFNYFALIAIFIACLGLFGLTSFIAEQKTKEIGIRKVLGASASKIMILLTREYILLIILANLLAWPLAWYGMNKWLESFAYRIDLNIGFFILAAAAAFLIAMVSVSSQFVKATKANPAESLRYE